MPCVLSSGGGIGPAAKKITDKITIVQEGQKYEIS